MLCDSPLHGVCATPTPSAIGHCKEDMHRRARSSVVAEDQSGAFSSPASSSASTTSPSTAQMAFSPTDTSHPKENTQPNRAHSFSSETLVERPALMTAAAPNSPTNSTPPKNKTKSSSRIPRTRGRMWVHSKRGVAAATEERRAPRNRGTDDGGEEEAMVGEQHMELQWEDASERPTTSPGCSEAAPPTPEEDESRIGVLQQELFQSKMECSNREEVLYRPISCTSVCRFFVQAENRTPLRAFI